MVMDPSRHSHAPWRKWVLIPFWIIQLFFGLLMIVVLALALGVVNSSWAGKKIDDYDGEVRKASKVVSGVYIGIISLCVILTITEIVQLVRHRLKPLFFLITNVIKTAIWTSLFILDIIAVIRQANNRRYGTGGLVVSALLVFSLWVPLVYGSIIYHRFRKEKKSYKNVESHHLAMPLDTSYPPVPYAQTPYDSRYKGTSDIEIGAGGRRVSYNHERDVRFESYRQEQSHSPENEPLTSGASIPELHVEHHDEQNFDMASRRELR